MRQGAFEKLWTPVADKECVTDVLQPAAPEVAEPLPRLDERGRDLRLDLLRGLCLAKIVVNHALPSPLHPLMNAIGFVDAAVGFFFISGIVLGVVYRKKVARQGLGASSKALWRRAGTLWLANFVLVLAFAAWDYFGRRFDVPHLGLTYKVTFFSNWHWYSLLSFDQPYLLQVLPRYVVYLAVTPLALWLLPMRVGWAVVVALTVIVWLATLMPGIDTRLWLVEHGRTGFRISAWQLPFFVGLTLGWHRQSLGGVWRRVARPLPITLLAAASIALAIWRAGVVEVPMSASLAWRVTNRDTLGAAWVANAIVFFPLIYWCTDRWWRVVSGSLGWLLLPLGQVSLYVFLVHVPLTKLTQFADGQLWPKLAGGWSALAVDVALLGLIWLLVRFRVLFGVVPR